MTLPTAIASLVFGTWVFGQEFSQATMPRLVAVDPRRWLVVVRKVVAILLVVVPVTAILFAAAFPAFDLLADRHDQGLEASRYLDTAVVALIANASYAILGAAFALITASMAGGLTAAFVFVFIFSIALSFVPDVDRWSFSTALADLTTAIEGSAPDPTLVDLAPEHRGPTAALLLVGWLALLLAVGMVRFGRSEVR